MRWFTDEALANEDIDWNDVVADYSDHLADVVARLPVEVGALATDPRFDLKDGRFREVSVDRTAHEVVLVVDCGSLQVGYRRLTVRFAGATIEPDNLQLLAKAVGAEFHDGDRDPERSVTEIRYFEIEPSAGCSIRLDGPKLWPFYEFAVAFDAVSISEEPLRRSRTKSPRVRSSLARPVIPWVTFRALSDHSLNAGWTSNAGDGSGHTVGE